MKYLFIGIEIELKKIKHLFFVHSIYIIPISFLVLLWLRSENISSFDGLIKNNNYEISLFFQYGLFILLVIPLITTLYPAIITNIEHKNNMKKVLYTLPYRTKYIFLSKVVLSFIFVFFTIIIEFCFFNVIIVILSHCVNLDIVIYYNVIPDYFINLLKLSYFLIPIIIIHTIIGVVFSSKILNISIGIFMSFATNFINIKNDFELFYIPPKSLK